MRCSSLPAPAWCAIRSTGAVVGRQEIQLRPKPRRIPLELQRLRPDIDLATARHEDVGDARLRSAVGTDDGLRALLGERQQLALITVAALAVVLPLDAH